MVVIRKILPFIAITAVLSACTLSNLLRGGIYRDLDENLTIVSLQQNPKRYLDEDIVISVRYYKKGDLPCPLGEDYVNFSIADRVSYITLNKVWIKKDKADILDQFKEMETIVMKARVFRVDDQKDPNLEAIRIVPE